MRKQLWSAVVSGWAFSLLCVGVLPAQSRPGEYQIQNAPYDAPSESGIQPTAYQPPPTGIPPAFEPYPAGLENAQAPVETPPMNPFPATSPYDNSFDQTFNEDGLWFRRVKNGRPIYYMNLDFWGAELKGPDGTASIGEPIQGVGSAWDATGSLTARLLEESAAQFPGYETTLEAEYFDLESRDFHEPANLGGLNPYLRRLGLRLNGGVVNPDYTGYEFGGYYITNRNQDKTFRRGSIERTPDPAVANAVSSNLPEFDSVDVLNSGRLTFDEGLIVNYSSQAWGAEVNMFGISPLNRDESIFLRTLFGLRYAGFTNSLSLVGNNSDLLGSLDILHTPLVVEDPPLPDITYSESNHNFAPRHQFSLKSQVTNQLVGPQIGIQPELGARGFKIIGWAKFAPMANFEAAKVSTENYGLPFTDGAKNASYSSNSWRYSTFLEMGGMMQAPVFQYIPYINTFPVIKSGVLRFGYNWVYVTDIGRSEKSVRYYSPLPKMEVKRSEQTLKGLFGGVGFHW